MVVCDGWNVKAGPAAKPASKVTEKK